MGGGGNFREVSQALQRLRRHTSGVALLQESGDWIRVVHSHQHLRHWQVVNLLIRGVYPIGSLWGCFFFKNKPLAALGESARRAASPCPYNHEVILVEERGERMVLRGLNTAQVSSRPPAAAPRSNTPITPTWKHKEKVFFQPHLFCVP